MSSVLSSPRLFPHRVVSTLVLKRCMGKKKTGKSGYPGYTRRRSRVDEGAAVHEGTDGQGVSGCFSRATASVFLMPRFYSPCAPSCTSLRSFYTHRLPAMKQKKEAKKRELIPQKSLAELGVLQDSTRTHACTPLTLPSTPSCGILSSWPGHALTRHTSRHCAETPPVRPRPRSVSAGDERRGGTRRPLVNYFGGRWRGGREKGCGEGCSPAPCLLLAVPLPPCPLVSRAPRHQLVRGWRVCGGES